MSVKDGFKPFLLISKDDIKGRAEQTGQPLTDSQAQEIYDDFESYDVNCELSYWENVDAIIFKYLDRERCAQK